MQLSFVYTIFGGTRRMVYIFIGETRRNVEIYCYNTAAKLDTRILLK